MKHLIIVLALVAMAGCGGGSSTNCSISDPVDPTYNLDGQTWYLSGTTPTNDCPSAVTTFSGSGTVSQSGNTISVTGTGFSLSGQISDGQIRWGGSIDLGTETLTIECTTVSVTGVAIGDTMSFSNVSWTVEYDGGSCSGTASGTFERTA